MHTEPRRKPDRQTPLIKRVVCVPRESAHVPEPISLYSCFACEPMVTFYLPQTAKKLLKDVVKIAVKLGLLYRHVLLLLLLSPSPPLSLSLSLSLSLCDSFRLPPMLTSLHSWVLSLPPTMGHTNGRYHTHHAPCNVWHAHV